MLYFIVIASGVGIAYCTWMAAFTETVEKHNPAATATGLAVWGWIIRVTVGVALSIFPFVVSSTSTLVDHGPRVQQIVATYPAQVKVLQTVDPATLAALPRDPTNPTAQARAASELSGLAGHRRREGRRPERDLRCGAGDGPGDPRPPRK